MRRRRALLGRREGLQSLEGWRKPLHIPNAAARILTYPCCPKRQRPAQGGDSTRSAAWVEVQAVVAISAATTKVRRARIMLTPYSTANSRDGCLRSAAVENLGHSRVPRHPLLRVQISPGRPK